METFEGRPSHVLEVQIAHRQACAGNTAHGDGGRAESARRAVGSHPGTEDDAPQYCADIPVLHQGPHGKRLSGLEAGFAGKLCMLAAKKDVQKLVMVSVCPSKAMRA